MVGDNRSHPAAAGRTTRTPPRRPAPATAIWPWP